jgi:hypothetical protein
VPWLSPKEVNRIVRAAVHGEVDPLVARCGLDPTLVALLPIRENRTAQTLSDLHELNRIGRLEIGTRPAKLWIRTALALLGPRSEAASLRVILKKPSDGTDPMVRP